MQGAVPETVHSLKSHMLAQLRQLGMTTPGCWEQAVFEVLTGGTRDDVDWSYLPNHTGYARWVATFGQLVAELILEGLVTREHRGGRAIVFMSPQAVLSN
jgi:hypothetical protein